MKKIEINQAIKVRAKKACEYIILITTTILVGYIIGRFITGPIAGTIVAKKVNNEQQTKAESFIVNWETEILNSFFETGTFGQSAKERYLQNAEQVVNGYTEDIRYKINGCIVYYLAHQKTVTIMPYHKAKWDILYPYKYTYESPIILKEPVFLSKHSFIGRAKDNPEIIYYISIMENGEINQIIVI